MQQTQVSLVGYDAVMSETRIDVETQNVSEQVAIWRLQANSIPGLLGGKAVWVPLVLNLVDQIGRGAQVLDLDSAPSLPEEIFNVEPQAGGAEPHLGPATWRQYLPFLKGLGLVEKGAVGLSLTATGDELFGNPTPAVLGRIFSDKIRLFAEILALIAAGPRTIEDVHSQVQLKYRPSWTNTGGTRSRIDWMEKLGLVSPSANRCWEVTEVGEQLLVNRTLVSPEALAVRENTTVALPIAPPEISALLHELRESVSEHQARSTYNIWAPSPATSPNKVENLRTIINAASTKIERPELFAFICDTFDLKRSSVESMMPFLRASGLLVEVGRGVYEATPAAKAWVESGEDVNFVRILHARMRFVGEMIRAVEPDVERSKMYAAGQKYGLNVEKCRWIASFLLSAELIEEPRYGSLRATATGIALVQELPLADPPDDHPDAKLGTDKISFPPGVEVESIKDRLVRLSMDPRSGGSKPGSEFERAVRDAFREMGFEARLISGSGDTDVLVQWQDVEGNLASAVVETKARSNGQVTHTDVSDVALETHRSRNNADFIAVIGPAFAGDTIRNMANQRGWSLLEAERIGALVEAAISLGLRPSEAALLFGSAKGLAELDDLIAERTRALDIVALIFSKLREEVDESGEAISARDISRDGRKSELAPSVPEVLAGIELVLKLQVNAIKQVNASEQPEYVTYEIGDITASVRQLRALADAMERLGS